MRRGVRGLRCRGLLSVNRHTAPTCSQRTAGSPLLTAWSPNAVPERRRLDGEHARMTLPAALRGSAAAKWSRRGTL